MHGYIQMRVWREMSFLLYHCCWHKLITHAAAQAEACAQALNMPWSVAATGIPIIYVSCCFGILFASNLTRSLTRISSSSAICTTTEKKNVARQGQSTMPHSEIESWLHIRGDGPCGYSNSQSFGGGQNEVDLEPLLPYFCYFWVISLPYTKQEPPSPQTPQQLRVSPCRLTFEVLHSFLQFLASCEDALEHR